ncbi:MAG: hypothetical protein F4W92_02380 [Gammaproteobacteria bacterium]|nr:hypothetical protein [Gammaproteobacteria bacterium]
MSRLAGFIAILLALMVSAITYPQSTYPLASTDSIERELKNIAQFESHFAQELALMRLVEGAVDNELHDVLLQSDEVLSRNFRHLVRSVAIRQLATIAPKEALERLSDWDSEVQTQFVSVVFQEWSFLDLEAALSHMQDLEKPFQRAALRGILDSRDDLDSEKLKEIASQFGLETITNAWLSESMSRNPIQDPERAWDELVQTFPDDLFEIEGAKLEFVAHVINANWEKDGINSLHSLYKSVRNRPGSVRLMHAFIDHLADKDPDLALEVVIDLDQNNDDLMASQRILRWADDDPFAALHASLKTTNKNLRKHFLRTFNLASAPDEISHLVIEELVSYPYDVIAPVLSQTMWNLTFHNPDLATQYLYLAEDYRTKLEIAQKIAETWSREDPDAALNWIGTDQEVEEMRDQLWRVVMKEMTLTKPEQAFQIALRQTTGESDIGPEAAVIEELSRSNFDRAVALLPQVRNSATMLSAASSVGLRAIENRKSSTIHEIAQLLEESNQSDFYESILPYWVWDDHQGLCDSLEELPNAELKNSAASSLFLKNEASGRTILNDTQRNLVESYLTVEQLDELSEFARKIDDLRYLSP